MELEVLEQTKNRMLVKIIGEDHTLLNLLKTELWKDSHIKVATYRIEHPLVGVPTLLIETDGKKDVKKALRDAGARLGKEVKGFQNSFIKAIK